MCREIPIEASMWRVDGMIEIFNKNGRGKPTKIWWETFDYDMNYMGCTRNMAIN